MKMTPAFLIIGGLMVFWASTSVNIFLPAMTMNEQPSASWRALTPDEAQGHQLYNDNGCSYCHSQFIRVMDWDIGADRIAEMGDYYKEQPIILGTARTGPDLSQEGGQHSDDWQIAHFRNPRWTRPNSLMPAWEFLGDSDINKLLAYVQSLGHKDADYRMARQLHWRTQLQEAYAKGPDANVEFLHRNVPETWRRMPNPYPAEAAGLARGQRVYQDYCIGCHGAMGDGQTPCGKIMNPPPLNFTLLRRHLVDGKYIGGILYYQIMNGVTGSAMPYFKKELESEKIWDVSNYVGVSFIGYTDGGIEQAIPAAYELPVTKKYPPPEVTTAPVTKPTTAPSTAANASP